MCMNYNMAKGKEKRDIFEMIQMKKKGDRKRESLLLESIVL